MFPNIIRHYSTAAATLNHYQLLDIPLNASIKDIKMQFKKLSKKYHPDLNQHLSKEDKEINNAKFVKMVDAYDTLKDAKKKRQYDMTLKSQGSFYGGQQSAYRRSGEFNNKYYGEAKYYSRSGSSHHYTASGYNTRRHRVYFNGNSAGASSSSSGDTNFEGQHRDYGNRYSVPHFDYQEHLNRNLKFEQLQLEKQLDQASKDRILSELKNSSASEEVKIKYLSRHVNSQRRAISGGQNNHTSSSGGSSYQQHMYQAHDDSGSMIRNIVIAGGALSSIYILFNLFS
ncbi:uncharacterized protein J8A68_001549 [[Candida] subhashii]|uniref:J domain-containing protein n=1 Tax=[Candida] subhashii TaxID=561895 RepID=A0A8J5QHU7_9ASCO|nr:uncharacterized protein J8A68_001549 [[Candida] subhashii]KAG7664911.1 hypothetical protein J8A68_001549 [[Candida] subhashii]